MGVDLLSVALLSWNDGCFNASEALMYPEHRIRASEALKHPWFDDIRMMFPNEEFQPYASLYWICFLLHTMVFSSEQLWEDSRNTAYSIVYMLQCDEITL